MAYTSTNTAPVSKGIHIDIWVAQALTDIVLNQG
ncbi:hypothetical protein EDD53_0725 [Pacificibacter maritimus]|uniref:Uncharacterized protein n=1 Tax=Pacificibacter maritimus TaxID=762213 RepID=A0A3N4UVS2_9RHOB|nr:hypothetical protein EDD53_0725 [Pacificibacter maritimus]